MWRSVGSMVLVLAVLLLPQIECSGWLFCRIGEADQSGRKGWWGKDSAEQAAALISRI